MSKERYNGVDYYDDADLAKGHMLKKAEEIYELLEEKHIVNNINEALELYTIDKYVKDRSFLLYLGEDKAAWLNEKRKIARSSVGRYINSNKNLLKEYNIVDYMYRKTFWEIVGEQKLSNIDRNDLVYFLNNQKNFVWQIFKCKKVVSCFDENLRNYMLDNPDDSTKIILDKYFIKGYGSKDKYYFPKSLTLEDKEKIISDYLDVEIPNLNYTRLLSQVQNTNEFSLDVRVKRKAKKVSERLEQEFFNEDNKQKLGTDIFVEFKENVDGIVKQYFSMKKVGTEVDKSWLQDNLDYATILNNFIYIFDFANKNMVSNFPYNEISAGVLEKAGFSYDKEYKTCWAFSLRESLSLFQIHAYYSFLKSNKINLEDVIEWFFNEYLDEEFGVKDYKVKLPPPENPNFEKCKSIFPTIENIVKKYKFYIEDGFIDEELVEMESKPLLFSECPSKTSDRYVYLHENNTEASIAGNMLFSDQNAISCFSNYGDKQYDTLIDRLCKDKLYMKDVEYYQEKSFEWLNNHGFVKIMNDGEIVIDNMNRTLLYYIVYNVGVIVPSKLPKGLKAEVDKLIKEGKLVVEEKLLTRQESDYIDYYLNKSNFINGKELRNKYLHGTSASYDNENVHYNNYLHALKLLITIVIKINDDLCTSS